MNVNDVQKKLLAEAIHSKDPAGEVEELIQCKLLDLEKPLFENGKLPLHLIVAGGLSFEIVKVILKHCPKAADIVDSFGNTPLHWACSNSTTSLEVIQALVLVSPTSLRILNAFSRSPLWYTCNTPLSFECIEFVCNQWPVACIILCEEGFLPLGMARKFANERALEYIERATKHVLRWFFEVPERYEEDLLLNKAVQDLIQKKEIQELFYSYWVQMEKDDQTLELLKPAAHSKELSDGYGDNHRPERRRPSFTGGTTDSFTPNNPATALIAAVVAPKFFDSVVFCRRLGEEMTKALKLKPSKLKRKLRAAGIDTTSSFEKRELAEALVKLILMDEFLQPAAASGAAVGKPLPKLVDEEPLNTAPGTTQVSQYTSAFVEDTPRATESSENILECRIALTEPNTGRMCYYNSEDGTTTWDRPMVMTGGETPVFESNELRRNGRHRSSSIETATSSTQVHEQIVQALVEKRPASEVEEVIKRNPLALTTPSKSYGQVPLHCVGVCETTLEIVSLILKVCPEAAHMMDDHKNTPLHAACCYSTTPLEVIEALVKASPMSLRALNDHDRSPLWFACNVPLSFECIEFLSNQWNVACLLPCKEGYLPLDVARYVDSSEQVIEHLENSTSDAYCSLNEFPGEFATVSLDDFLSLNVRKQIKTKTIQALAHVRAIPGAISETSEKPPQISTGLMPALKPATVAHLPRNGVWILKPSNNVGSGISPLELQYCYIRNGYSVESISCGSFSTGSKLFPRWDGDTFIQIPSNNDTNDKYDQWKICSLRQGDAQMDFICSTTLEFACLDNTRRPHQVVVSDGFEGIYCIHTGEKDEQEHQSSRSAPSSPHQDQYGWLIQINKRFPNTGVKLLSTIPVTSKIITSRGGGVWLVIGKHPRRHGKDASLGHGLWYLQRTDGSKADCQRFVEDIPESSLLSHDDPLDGIWIVNHSEGGTDGSLTVAHVTSKGVRRTAVLDARAVGIRAVCSITTGKEDCVYIHCKVRDRWMICSVTLSSLDGRPCTAALAQGDSLSLPPPVFRKVVDCPKQAVVSSCGRGGVWIWKKTQQRRTRGRNLSYMDRSGKVYHYSSTGGDGCFDANSIFGHIPMVEYQYSTCD